MKVPVHAAPLLVAALCGCSTAAKRISFADLSTTRADAALLAVPLAPFTEATINEYDLSTKTTIRNCVGVFKTGFQSAWVHNSPNCAHAERYMQDGEALTRCTAWVDDGPTTFLLSLPPGTYVAGGTYRDPDSAAKTVDGLAFTIRRSDRLVLPPTLDVPNSSTDVDAVAASHILTDIKSLQQQRFVPAAVIAAKARPVFPCFVGP